MIISREEAKLSLNITWDMGPVEEMRLDQDILSATAYVEDFAGYPIKETDTVGRQLIKDCLRYIWNHVLSEFQVNYSEDLIMIREKYRAENYVEESVSSDNDV